MLSFIRSKRFWLTGIFLLIVATGSYAAWQLLLPEESPAAENTEITRQSLPKAGARNTESAPALNEAKKTSGSTSNASSGQTGSATADGYNDFGSCEADIDAYCSGFGGGNWEEFAEENGYITASYKLGLVDCLEKNRDKTSEVCDASLDRRATLNDDVNTLCAVDRAEHCRGVEPKPGSEPMIDCLKEHYDDLSGECAAAVDAHEAAKPTAE